VTERIEFESEAWYRLVAEGRLPATSDRGSPGRVPVTRGLSWSDGADSDVRHQSGYSPVVTGERHFPR
jgi:hypothetical protein